MKVKQNDMVLFNVIKKGEYGLLNPLTRKLHRINETGRFIWDKCREAKNIDELVPLVAQQFDISKEIAQKDTKDFIERMIRFQLLEEL